MLLRSIIPIIAEVLWKRLCKPTRQGEFWGASVPVLWFALGVFLLNDVGYSEIEEWIGINCVAERQAAVAVIARVEHTFVTMRFDRPDQKCFSFIL